MVALAAAAPFLFAVRGGRRTMEEWCGDERKREGGSKEERERGRRVIRVTKTRWCGTHSRPSTMDRRNGRIRGATCQTQRAFPSNTWSPFNRRCQQSQLQHPLRLQCSVVKNLSSRSARSRFTFPFANLRPRLQHFYTTPKVSVTSNCMRARVYASTSSSKAPATSEAFFFFGSDSKVARSQDSTFNSSISVTVFHVYNLTLPSLFLCR